jgi:nucleoside-diphosphate-sugar epimerase
MSTARATPSAWPKESALKHFHLVSSIAAAGLFEGLFREDMFDEAENLDNPYFRTKHDSEGIVRKECRIPWRIFRPGIVVGDSRTGEMDKIDGPYYFFKLIQKMRRMFPSWMPTIGIEGGRINVVPVDFVVAAMDHIAHLENEDGQCFHLTDPTPMRVGDLLNTFARAAHAPEMAMRINAALLGFIPRSVRKAMFALTPVRRIRSAVMKDLGLPDDILDLRQLPDPLRLPRDPARPQRQRHRRAAAGQLRLAPVGLLGTSPRPRSVHRSHLARADRREGRLVTGGSSGIGKATIRKMAEAGAIAVTIARDAQALEDVRREFEAAGLRLITQAVDIADPEQCAAFVKFMARSTAASTSWSTMPAARFAAASRTPSIASMISNGRWRSTISERCG